MGDKPDLYRPGLEDSFRRNEYMRYQQVATSAFGSIFTVTLFCGCIYFACARHNRKARREMWRRGSNISTNTTTSSLDSRNMLITPYPTNPDLGIPVVNADMNYTGSAPNTTGPYSCDPVIPQYFQNTKVKYDGLVYANEMDITSGQCDKNGILMANAARIKENIKISQPTILPGSGAKLSFIGPDN